MTSTNTADLNNAIARFEDWMVKQALPLWANAGFDHQSGSAYEQLLNDGTPDQACDKRIRVQARQMFVFSVATARNWLDCGADRIKAIQQFLNQYARHPAQPDVYVHKLTPDNQLSDAKQDTYDLAFFMLSSAWRYRVFKDAEALQQAEAIVQHLDSAIKGNNSGWLEGDYAASVRRQNPHMHLFEAFLALFDATGEAKWLARAGEIFSLFENRFFDAKHQVLLEYFQPDWTPLTAQEGQVVEPGHMMEWVWLLHTYSARTGTPVKYYTDALYRNALAFGQEQGSGLLFDECSASGEIIKATKRCWPMTELIKASLAEAAAGNSAAEITATNAINALFNHYISAEVKGAYGDQLNGENQLINDKAPASTLYHLLVAVIESVDYRSAQK